jgi:hypothetical protein
LIIKNVLFFNSTAREATTATAGSPAKHLKRQQQRGSLANSRYCQQQQGRYQLDREPTRMPTIVGTPAMQHKGVRNVGNTRNLSDISSSKEGSNRRDSSHNRDPTAKQQQ